VLGLLCGRRDQPLRAAVNEATVSKCGIDVYVTPPVTGRTTPGSATWCVP